MNRTFKAVAVLACAMLTSCTTISHPIAVTTHPFGTKCGVAESHIYLWTWSSKGGENGIDKAAKQAGITKISHVDSYTKSYFWGIVTKQTTKVYGE